MYLHGSVLTHLGPRMMLVAILAGMPFVTFIAQMSFFYDFSKNFYRIFGTEAVARATMC